MFLGQPLLHPIAEPRQDNQSDRDADSHTEKYQTEDTDAESVLVWEHRREGGKEKVEIAVDQCEVQRKARDDGAPGKHLHRPGDRAKQDGSGAGGRLEVGIGILRLVDPGSFGAQNGRRVTLRQAEEGDDGEDATKDHQQPEDPPPAGVLRDETPHDGPQDRT